jgi:histidine ammonia-lyase
MSYVKAAIPVLASISERRLNKLVDPATSDGLPGFLVGNEDGTESGFMIVQYTAAAIVNDLASRAMPATVYSIPTSANAEDHVSMGANEARHVLAMADDLGKVLALELVTAAQALDLRVRMVEGEAHPGRAVAAAHEAIRARIAFLEHDRALDGDVRAALALVEEGAVLAAARAVVP